MERVNVKPVIDDISKIVTVSSETTLSDLQDLLLQSGYQCPYFPSSGSADLPLRHFLKNRIPNKKRLRYGDLEDVCLSLAVNKAGHRAVTKAVPRAATGPDFKKIFVGTDEFFGKAEKVTLRIISLPEKIARITLAWKEMAKKSAFRKAFWGSGVSPADFEEVGLKISIVLEGVEELVQAEKECVVRLARRYKAQVKEL